MKNKIAQFFRTNEKDLEKEIQRCKDTLAVQEVGTKEYKDTLDCYNTLLTQEKELKKLKTDVNKYITAGAIGIAGMLLYRKLIDTSADPFFRDIARNLLKIVHV